MGGRGRENSEKEKIKKKSMAKFQIFSPLFI
jgi:hypothetical protein